MKKLLLLFTLFTLHFTLLRAQVSKAPNRAEGDGPHKRLIIRGVTIINSTGSPPIGPMDIVVEQIRQAGYPGMPDDPRNGVKANPGDKELDCKGMYLMPGFVDMHGHIGGVQQGANAEYVFKLWMAHGVTTIRDPSCGNGLDWVLDQKEKSAKNLITAPPH